MTIDTGTLQSTTSYLRPMPEWSGTAKRALELLSNAEEGHDRVAWITAAQVHATLAVADALERLILQRESG